MTQRTGSQRSLPAGEGLVQVEVRLSASTVAAIDQWRRDRPDRPSRAQVIRQIVDAAVQGEASDSLPSAERFSQVLR